MERPDLVSKVEKITVSFFIGSDITDCIYAAIEMSARECTTVEFEHNGRTISVETRRLCEALHRTWAGEFDDATK